MLQYFNLLNNVKSVCVFFIFAIIIKSTCIYILMYSRLQLPVVCCVSTNKNLI